MVSNATLSAIKKRFLLEAGMMNDFRIEFLCYPSCQARSPEATCRWNLTSIPDEAVCICGNLYSTHTLTDTDWIGFAAPPPHLSVYTCRLYAPGPMAPLYDLCLQPALYSCGPCSAHWSAGKRRCGTCGRKVTSSHRARGTCWTAHGILKRFFPPRCCLSFSVSAVPSPPPVPGHNNTARSLH